jgi:polyhydroxybutyrate depolymerase
MKRRGRALRILAVIAICLAVAIPTHAQLLKFTVDGAQRKALIFPPSKRSGVSERDPVIFAFHWHGGTMQEAATAMQFQKLWPEAIVVYMQGQRTRIYVDPLGFHSGWQQEPGQFNDRDLKFFDMVLSAVRMTFPVNEDRIYATGFSNGGIFTYLLWGTRGNVFAAIARWQHRSFRLLILLFPNPFCILSAKRIVLFRSRNSCNRSRSLVS